MGFYLDMSSSMLAPTGTRRVLIASIIVLGILFFGTNIFVTRGTNADLVSFTPDQVKLMTSKMTTQMDLFLNFICSCEKRNLSWKDFVFVFALDAEAKVFLDSHGVAAYHLDDTDVANAAEKFSDHTFKKVIFWKSAVTYDVLLLEVNVIFQDVDIVWKSSPVSYFQDPKMQSIDVFFMKDGNNNGQQPLYANSGFHFNRYNERTLLLWEETYLMGHTSNAQQTILSPLLIHHYFVNGLRIYLLPPRFTNGNYWMGKNKIDRVPSDWVVLHASWTTNMEAKIEKFGWMNEWYTTCVAGKNAK